MLRTTGIERESRACALWCAFLASQLLGWQVWLLYQITPAVSNYCRRIVTVVLGLAALPAGNAILTSIHGVKGGGRYCKASKYLEPEPWGRSLGLNILRSPDYSNLGGTEQGPGLPPCVWPGSNPRCSLEACYKHAEFQAQKCLSPLPLVQPAFWRRMANILEGRYVFLPLSFGWWVWGPWFVELVLSCMETVGSLRKKTFIKSGKENK